MGKARVDLNLSLGMESTCVIFMQLQSLKYTCRVTLQNGRNEGVLAALLLAHLPLGLRALMLDRVGPDREFSNIKRR